MNWLNIIAVFIGSGIGGVCRYMVSRVIQTNVSATPMFPWGTFAVNIAGCFLIGLLYGLIDRHNTGVLLSEQARLLLTVGFCGGFTTFSTFVNENYILLQSSHLLLFSVYMAASIIAGLILFYAGSALGHLN